MTARPNALIPSLQESFIRDSKRSTSIEKNLRWRLTRTRKNRFLAHDEVALRM